MKEPAFLLRDVVEYLHDQAVRRHGGLLGLRDEAMLESALARPGQKWAYEEPPPDLFDLAAAYAFGLCRNHAFIDGNKRAGWAACVLFLSANGLRLHCQTAEILEKVLLLAEGRMTEADFATWLRNGAVV